MDILIISILNLLTMKKIIPLFLVLLLFNSCTTSYLVTSAGESFDSLTKITEREEECLYPNGGDDGENLTFTVKESDGYFNIYLKDKVLTNAIIQKTAGNNFNFFPDYCSENQNIVFQYYANDNFDIYYINAYKGKAITQITNTDENEYCPSWSKDGKLIAFEKGMPPNYYVTTSKLGSTKTKGVSMTANQIWIKNIDTGELKMIGEGSYPKISPDGKQIVYVKYELSKGAIEKMGTIWIMNIDGDTPKQITSGDLGYAINPCWSPNGEHIAFTLLKKKKKDFDIYTIDVDGETLRQHTTNESSDFAPYWSAEGNIYFSSDRGSKSGDYQIWRFKI